MPLRCLRRVFVLALVAVLGTIVPPVPAARAALIAHYPQATTAPAVPVPPPPPIPRPLTLPRSQPARAPIVVPDTPDFSALPLVFTPNVGQMDARARFSVHGLQGQVFFTDNGVSLALPQPITDTTTLTPTLNKHDDVANHYVVRMQWLNSAGQPKVVGTHPLPGRINMQRGKDTRTWHTNIPTYGGVTYEAIYPGIDLHFDGQGQQLKRTYTVAPGADVSRIQWNYTGHTKVAVDTAGRLIVSLPYHPKKSATAAPPVLQEDAPKAWQTVAGTRHLVEVRYRIEKDGSVGFRIGAYNSAYALTIDPTLLYSATLGGSGEDVGNAIVLDAAGNAYIAGRTRSADLPGASTTFKSNWDGFVTKLNPTGTAILYTTYIGSSSYDFAQALALGPDGSVYVTGFTTGDDFVTTSNAFQPVFGGWGFGDAFVTKLNPAGTITYSTYFGGGWEEEAYAISLSASGLVTIAGTGSAQYNYTNPAIPTTADAYQSAPAGGGDVFLATFQLGAANQLIYSTFIGGTSDDVAYALAEDSDGVYYLTGNTESRSFPTTANALDRSCGGFPNFCSDAFIIKFDRHQSGAAQLRYSAFLGGSDIERGKSIAVDSQHNIVVVGQTNSGSDDTERFPTVNAFQPNSGSSNGDGFVAKLAATLDRFIFSTYLGGTSGGEVLNSVVVDSADTIYAAGLGDLGDPGYPTVNPVQSGGGYGDVAITRLSPTGQVNFSTLLGGGWYDWATGIAVNPAGWMYVTGVTYSGNYPVTPNTLHAGSDSVLVAAIIGPAVPIDQARCNCGPQHQTLHPVNTKTGNFWTTTTDLAVQTPGPALTWQRTYVSHAITETTTTFGYGWQSAYAARLITAQMPTGEPNTIIVFDPSGNRLRFTDTGSGQFFPWAGVFSTLVQAGSVYTQTLRDQTQYAFDASDGRLLRIQDPLGRTVQLDYSGTTLTRIVDVHDPSRALTLSYTNGRIDYVSDGMREVHYAYNTNGDLITVTDVMGRPTSYAYTNHRLTAITNALGELVEGIGYDFSVWPTRVVSQTLHNGTQIAFDYTKHTTTMTTTGTDGQQSVERDYYAVNNTLAGVEQSGQALAATSYDDSFSPSQVSDGNGKTTRTSFTTNGLPTITTDPLGQQTFNQYDTRNNLTETRNAVNTTRFSYDLLGNITRATAGIAPSTPLGLTTIFTYTYNLRYPGDSLLSEQQAPDGVVTHYDYNGSGQLVRETTGFGTALATRTQYGYDAQGRRASITYAENTPLERTDRTEYNADNTVARTIQNWHDGVFSAAAPDEDIVTRYGYDALGRPSWAQDVFGQYTVTQYDGHGHVTWTAKNFTQAGWHEGPLPATPPAVTQSQPDQNVATLYAYDGLGRTVLVTETGYFAGFFTPTTRRWDTVDTRVTRTEYDTLSRPITTTLNYRPQSGYDGSGTSVPLFTRYDGVGNVIAHSDELGRWTAIGYDAASRPVTTTVNFEDGNPLTGVAYSDIMRVTTYDVVGRATREVENYVDGVFTTTEPITDRTTLVQYDSLDRATTVVENAEGTNGSARTDTQRVQLHAYDPSTGRLIGDRDALSRWTSYRYDALGRVSQVIQNCSNGTTPDQQTCSPFNPTTPDRNVVTQTRYDAVGRVYETVDPLQVVQHTDFDQLGRVTRTVQNYVPGQPTTPITNVTALTSYDALGRVVATTDPTGATRRSGYDTLGRTTTTTDPLGRVTTYGYDGLGALRWTLQPDGRLDSQSVSALGWPTTQITNHMTNVADPTKPVDQDLLSQTRYDSLGRPDLLIDAAGRIQDRAYTPIGTLHSVRENLAGQFSGCVLAPCTVGMWYEYDRVGNRTAMHDARGNVRHFAYDAANRVTSSDDGAGHVIGYTYDKGDRTLAQIDPRGAAYTLNYTYDGRDQTTQLQATNLGTIAAVYDARGQRTQLTDGTGTTTFSYDPLGRITTVAAPQSGTVGYAYNGRGQRTQLRYPNGTTVGYQYRADGQLATVTQGSTTLADYGYDGLGRLAQLVRANGTVTAYGYDQADRLRDIQTTKNGTTLSHFAYGVNRNGLRTQVVETLGSTARTVDYTYDGLNRLTDTTATTGSSYHYAYDATGNRTQAWRDGQQVQSFTYNAANQVSDTGWAYDLWGNLTSDGTNSYTYDALNRVVTQNGTTATYNGDGVLATQTTGGTTTQYTQDLAGPLDQVLSDGTRTFVYGAERLAADQGGVRTWYATDALNSVRQTVDDAGTVLSTTMYNPWGGIESGSVASFGFTGELQNAANGLTYLRARWYNPATGTFTAQRWRTDESSDTVPYSHHAYAYALGNPVLWADPSGRCPQWLTAGCNATGIDPDTWQHVPGIVKGAYGIDRNASDLDFTGALIAKPYEPIIESIQTVTGVANLIIDERARAAGARNLTPEALGRSLIHPWQDEYQGITCGDGYLIGRGTIGIANQLLAAYGLYRGVQGLKSLLRSSPQVEQLAVAEVVSEAVNSNPSPYGPARTAAIRSALNASKGRNIAIVNFEINGIEGELIGVSGPGIRPGTVNPPSHRFFVTTIDRWPRPLDSEVKILEDLAHQFAQEPGVYRNARGVVNLYSERRPCDSCKGVIEQFEEMFPNIKVNVSYGTKEP